MDGVELILGDCLDVMRGMDAESVDAVITDPPYPKEFDSVWGILGNEAPRVMKPDSFLATLCGHYQMPRVIDAMRRGGARMVLDGDYPQ